MRGEAQVLLGDLELHHQGRLRHGAEERVEGLARLEVDGTVLDLHEHVRPELPVEGLELVVGLLRPVLGHLVRVHEGAPHHDAPVRPDGVGQHVRALGVGPSVVLRPGLALGVGLHEEPPEVGDDAVDLVGLAPPPGRDLRVERVGRLQPADLDRGAEARGEVDADPVGPEDPRERRGLGEVLREEARRVRVDVREDGAVDADRGVRARVVGVAGVEVVRQLVPVPEREARVPALDRPVQVVPVVQHPEPGPGGLGDRQALDRLVRLQQPQEVEDAVQHAHVGVRRDDGGALPPDPRRADDEALLADAPEVLPDVRPRHEGRPRRQAGHEQAVTGRGRDERDVHAEEPAQRPGGLRPRRPQRRRASLDRQPGDRGAVALQQRRVGDGSVPQPELVAVLGPHPRGRHQQREQEDRRPRRAQAHRGTSGTRPSFGSAQRSLGTSGAHPGRSGSWS